MKNRNITIGILIFIIILGYFIYRPTQSDIDNSKDMIENIELTIKNKYHKKKIKRHNIDLTPYISINDSISKVNINYYELYKDSQTETETIDTIVSTIKVKVIKKKDLKDTIIESFKYEIDIKDTIIKYKDTIILEQDSIIHNLEIKEVNYLTNTNKLNDKIIKSEKKIKRKNIWIAISTTIATVLTIILITN